MKSIILCEGSTDFVLLQYFMQTVYGWQDKSDVRELKNNFKRVRKLVKGEDSLIIGGCGGCSRLLPCLEYILEINSLSAENEAYDKIIVITDRDEISTEGEFTENIERLLNAGNISMDKDIHNNEWVICSYRNGHGKAAQSQILLLVIPLKVPEQWKPFY